MKICILGYCQLSERILVVKLNGKPFNISIILVNLPSTQSTGKENGKYFSTLNNAKALCKSQEFISVMRDPIFTIPLVGNETDGEIV